MAGEKVAKMKDEREKVMAGEEEKVEDGKEKIMAEKGEKIKDEREEVMAAEDAGVVLADVAAAGVTVDVSVLVVVEERKFV